MLHGYVKDFPGFQLLLMDEENNVVPLTEEIRGSLDQAWVQANALFEAECESNPAFEILKDRMFPVGDGNHRLFSWMQVAKQFPHKKKYHARVIAKFLWGNKEDLLEIIAALQAFNS
ncbi:unnamed protein product [Calypogeia fissa]